MHHRNPLCTSGKTHITGGEEPRTAGKCQCTRRKYNSTAGKCPVPRTKKAGSPSAELFAVSGPFLERYPAREAHRPAGEDATSQISKDGKNRLEIFRFNPGKDKALMPPKNPYTKVGGAKEAKAVIEKQATPQFREIKRFKNGGGLHLHDSVDTEAGDYQKVYESALDRAKAGGKAEILPKLHPRSAEYAQVYKDLTGTKYEGKSPDFRVDGNYYEHEGFDTGNNKNALRNMLKRGVKQASRIVIEDEGSTENFIRRVISNRVAEGQDIDEVWQRQKDGTLKRIF